MKFNSCFSIFVGISKFKSLFFTSFVSFLFLLSSIFGLLIQFVLFFCEMISIVSSLLSFLFWLESISDCKKVVRILCSFSEGKFFSSNSSFSFKSSLFSVILFWEGKSLFSIFSSFGIGLTLSMSSPFKILRFLFNSVSLESKLLCSSSFLFGDNLLSSILFSVKIKLLASKSKFLFGISFSLFSSFEHNNLSPDSSFWYWETFNSFPFCIETKLPSNNSSCVKGSLISLPVSVS